MKHINLFIFFSSAEARRYAGVTPCPASSSCTVTGRNSHLPHCKAQGLLALARLSCMAVPTTARSEARSAPLVTIQLVGEAFPSAASPPHPAPRVTASLLGARGIAPYVGATQSASVKPDPEGLGNLCQWECLTWISLADLIGCGNTWGYVGRSGKEGQWHPAEKGKQPEGSSWVWGQERGLGCDSQQLGSEQPSGLTQLQTKHHGWLPPEKQCQQKEAMVPPNCQISAACGKMCTLSSLWT